MASEHLMGRLCTQCGHSGQKDDSCPLQDGVGQYQISSLLLRRASYLKLCIVYFWNFWFNIFGLQLMLSNQTRGNETVDERDHFIWSWGHYSTQDRWCNMIPRMGELEAQICYWLPVWPINLLISLNLSFLICKTGIIAVHIQRLVGKSHCHIPRGALSPVPHSNKQIRTSLPPCWYLGAEALNSSCQREILALSLSIVERWTNWSYELSSLHYNTEIVMVSTSCIMVSSTWSNANKVYKRGVLASSQ